MVDGGWTISIPDSDDSENEMGQVETQDQETQLVQYETHELIPVIPRGPSTLYLIGLRWTLDFWFKHYRSKGVLGSTSRWVCTKIWKSKSWNEYKRFIVEDMMDCGDWKNLLLPRRRPNG